MEFDADGYQFQHLFFCSGLWQLRLYSCFTAAVLDLMH